MDPSLTVALAIGMLLVLLLSGLPIGFSLGVTSLFFIFVVQGAVGLSAVSNIAFHSMAHFTLIAVPLYLLMGEVIIFTGLGVQLYDAGAKWIGRVPGGLGVATAGACGFFAAISGSSVATAVTIGSVAIPELRRWGYDIRFALGLCASGGTLGVLIPPSIVMVVYGIVTEQSVAMLFMASVVPGIMMVVFHALYSFLVAIIRPSMAPRATSVSWGARWMALLGIWPWVVLLLGVLISIYMGIATPTEAAALGALITILLGAFVSRNLTARKLADAVCGTVVTTSMVGIIMVGAVLFSYILAYIQVPQAITEAITTSGIPPWVVLLAINILWLFLGCLLDSISIMLLTLPIAFPVLMHLGFNPIWLGVVMTMNLEIGMITPPMGMTLFAIKGVVKDAAFTDVVAGAAPFILLWLVGLAIVIVFPGLTLWLPGTMPQ
ncbi:MAG: TRAP transporter large permease [Betaproteobacteria bacterium]|nr:TRAP transporter large permease [Betaproteobacteria bacterium]